MTDDQKYWKDLEEASIANNLEMVKSLVEKDPLQTQRSLQTIAGIAARLGHRAIFEYAVEKQPSILEKEDDLGQTVAHIAASNGRRDIITYIGEKNPSALTTEDRFRHTALYLALKNDIIKTVETLKIFVEDKGLPLTELESLASIAAAKGKLEILRYIVGTETALFGGEPDYGNLARIGVANGHSNIVRYIAQKTPFLLNSEDPFGNNLLHMAAKHCTKDIKLLKFLLDSGVSLIKTNACGQDAAYFAAESGNLNAIRFIEETDPSLLEKKYRNGETIVHRAVKRGLWKIVRYIVEKKPSLLTIKDDHGNTILHTAAKCNNLNRETLEFLLDEKGVLIQLNETNNYGRTIADIAIHQKNLEVVQYVGERMPSVLVNGNINGDVPLKYALYTNFLDIRTLKLLIENCGPLIQSCTNTTMLGKDGSLDMMQYLMAKNPPPQFESQALHQAIDRPLPIVIKFLIEERKTDVNLLNERGESPIFTAVRAQRRDIIKYLADERNTNLTVANPKGENILYIAVEKHDVQTMQYVLDNRRANIDLEWRNKLGETVLHVAVRRVLDLRGQVKETMTVLEYLVREKNVDVNVREREEKTPLHYAALRSNIRICDYLLKHGANPEIQDSSGRNYWDYATFNRSRRYRRHVNPPHYTTYILPSVSREWIEHQLNADSFHLDGPISSVNDHQLHSSQFQNFLTIGKWIVGKTKLPFPQNYLLSPSVDTLQSKINAAAMATVDIIQNYQY